ncbi:YggS family pyridoxal phosphate-dependent enzyme [Pelomicrobium methylotrophicum]|uniref:Pyridoxal phosphate homeostasis protein n=1 Tax=Pelomicrobium methylotrophicum TaxID=2602750 RepID=A0A5C7EV25_9PROT|nr:YggS family pyridoxal phosphate-dependent enzyme [Pelomicrobium methylotrophicum]TXF12657.1 YggS family pyridoxal phosphate-dependent enzyme [Pelomicrobium methylotrophicum]
MSTIGNRLQAVAERIRRAAEAAGRAAQDIQLVAVSKTCPPEAVREAHRAGQRAFGESYVQEALEKMDALADLPLEWHFIGPIQSNKTGPIARRFAWVHGVDRDKIARRLADARPPEAPPLNICIQVNVSGEASKSGVAPDEVLALARTIISLPRLKLRGLMAIPRPTDDEAEQRRQFRTLRTIRDELEAHGIATDTLSMGMSDDLEAAIAEGATLVRVGTAIFGARAKKTGRKDPEENRLHKA